MRNNESHTILAKQASLFTHYLLKKEANSRVTEVFIRAIEKGEYVTDKSDQRLLQLIVKRPWLLGLLDAGLPFVSPYSELRRRIYLMLAILESDPEYSGDFLPKKRGLVYIFSVGISSIFALIKSAVGIVLLKVLA